MIICDVCGTEARVLNATAKLEQWPSVRHVCLSCTEEIEEVETIVEQEARKFKTQLYASRLASWLAEKQSANADKLRVAAQLREPLFRVGERVCIAQHTTNPAERIFHAIIKVVRERALLENGQWYGFSELEKRG